jgi:hypothetical protein
VDDGNLYFSNLPDGRLYRQDRWADTSDATNSVIPQIAYDAKPANPRRVSMLPSLSDREFL